jgi:hypothetical protein
MTPTETHTFEQVIDIQGTAAVVERCLTDQGLMHQWLNPALRCDAIGEWSVTEGSRSRFIIQIPVWEPSLFSEVVERTSHRIVWQFTGFFEGTDCWEWQDCTTAVGQKIRLRNCFTFKIPNPWVSLGFRWLAAPWTKRDMEAQLRRIQALAESLASGG